MKRTLCTGAASLLLCLPLAGTASAQVLPAPVEEAVTETTGVLPLPSPSPTPSTLEEVVKTVEETLPKETGPVTGPVLEEAKKVVGPGAPAAPPPPVVAPPAAPAPTGPRETSQVPTQGVQQTGTLPAVVMPPVSMSPFLGFGFAQRGMYNGFRSERFDRRMANGIRVGSARLDRMSPFSALAPEFPEQEETVELVAAPQTPVESITGAAAVAGGLILLIGVGVARALRQGAAA